LSAPEALTSVKDRLDPHLDRFLAVEAARWSEVDEALAEPFESLRRYVGAGGKRLRPAFCHWAWVGAGGDPGGEAALDCQAALEMLHTAALVHDDLIDGSSRRHDQPTVHVAFASGHSGRSWRGSSDRFGAGVSVIVGDLALVYSSHLARGMTAQAGAHFEEMRVEVNVGQYLDILGSAHGLGTREAVERARRICRFKTAKYTIERPLHIGAAMAAPERDTDLAAPLSAFGLPLGEAFQLRDDILGVFGDPGVTGKPVGDDLREGKLTVLAAVAAERAGAAGRGFVERFGHQELTAADVAAMQELIAGTGALEAVEAEIQALVGQARAALADLPVTLPARRALGEIAEFVAVRDR
jgi:geranylgeranyl diphosphate synthase type I